jgi:hypothetical protein
MPINIAIRTIFSSIMLWPRQLGGVLADGRSRYSRRREFWMYLRAS